MVDSRNRVAQHALALLAGERIIVVPNEVPVPVNSGGRVDVWRRICALTDSGAALGLLSWYDGPRDGAPTAEQRQLLDRHCEGVHLSCISRQPAELLGRLAHAWHLPSHVASRWVTLDRRAALQWARQFRPTLLLADGLYGAHVVRWLAAQLGVRWIYRSHNIEHRYMGMQLAQATRWQSRLGLMANLWGLARFERSVIAGASAVMDISASDLEFWRARGMNNLHWVPPLVDREFAAQLAAGSSTSQFDALYFGNLNTPNNVEAVRWLITRVMPHVADENFSVAIAGSRPTREVVDLAAQDVRITLIANPPEMASLVASAKVLLNPVQGGSGVNLKSVEMLFSNAQLLSTPTGVQGLPDDVAACFRRESDPIGFAQAMAALRDQPALGRAELQLRLAARESFSFDAAARRLSAVVLDARRRASELP